MNAEAVAAVVTAVFVSLGEAVERATGKPCQGIAARCLRAIIEAGGPKDVLAVLHGVAAAAEHEPADLGDATDKRPSPASCPAGASWAVP
jgi:hypothetical protein